MLALEGTEQRAYGIHLRYFVQLQGNLQLAPNIKLQKCNKNCFPSKTPATFVLSIIKKAVLSYIDIQIIKPQETRGKEDSIQSKTISSSIKNEFVVCFK